MDHMAVPVSSFKLLNKNEAFKLQLTMYQGRFRYNVTTVSYIDMVNGFFLS